MEFSRQEYWSGLPCPPPWDLPDPGMEPASFMSPALAGEFFNASTTWEAHLTYDWMLIVTSFGELGPGLKGPEIFPGHSLGRCNQLWNPLKPVSVSTAPSLSPHSRIRSWLYYWMGRQVGAWGGCLHFTFSSIFLSLSTKGLLDSISVCA